jgi:N-methylhydantoinase A
MDEMAIKKALIPNKPGLLAAYGLLTEDMRRDFVQTYVMELSADVMKTVEKRFRYLEKEADEWFDKEKIDIASRTREYFLDMRYKGQNHEISVPISADDIYSEKTIRDAFIKTYMRLYSFSSDDSVQIVNFGLSAIGTIMHPLVTEDAYDGVNAEKAVIGSRKVYEGDGKYVDYILYDREKLRNGNVVFGPAIIEQMDSTTLVHSGQKATVDKYLNMILERR